MSRDLLSRRAVCNCGHTFVNPVRGEARENEKETASNSKKQYTRQPKTEEPAYQTNQIVIHNYCARNALKDFWIIIETWKTYEGEPCAISGSRLCFLHR